MDYEKKYKEAIEKAKEIVNDEHASSVWKGWLCNCFPELKESEDERIRKELLEHCINRRDGKQVCVDASDYRRWADWLFRQGIENIPNVKSDREIRKEIIKFLELPHPQFVGKGHQEKWIAWLEKQGKSEYSLKSYNQKDVLKFMEYIEKIAKDYDFNIPNGSYDIYAFAKDILLYLEKQGGHEVEPKFKVGDWIIFAENHDSIYQVEKIDNYRYYLRHYLGGTLTVHFDNEMSRLWTIEDAKDGDVLVRLPVGDKAGKEQMFIFKGINNSTYVKNVIEYYGRVYDGAFYINKSGYMGTTSTPLCPATKEQRDTLLKAIADAGYEFDFEKKDLKKIK